MNALVQPSEHKLASLFSVEIEQGLLGAILNSNAVFDGVEPLITPDDFYEPLHGQLYETFANVRHDGGLITLPLVIAAMGGDGATLIAEGMTARQYAARLAAEAVTVREAPAYARQIHEFSDRRKALATAETIIAGVYATRMPQLLREPGSICWIR